LFKESTLFAAYFGTVYVSLVTAVAQWLRCCTTGRWFDSSWCHCNFWLT